jgi:lipopolysaccharide/colanic/teichoic acid biosynthesis glycosyltransferase
VFLGQMSFVGPRPDVPGFADMLEGEDRIILSIPPGITGPASIYFKDEEALLAAQQNPEEYNRKVIWPKKVELNKEYIKQYSVFKDVVYIVKTVF